MPIENHHFFLLLPSFKSFCLFRFHVILVIICINLFAVEHVFAGSDDTSKPFWLHIREIKFKGNDITKSKIILREMSIREGDSILNTNLKDELNFNKRRILNLQLFSVVNYEVFDVGDHTIDIEFDMSEIYFWIPKPEFALADRNFNVWWKEQHHDIERTNIGLQLTRVNFRGRSERIGGTIQVGYNKFFDVFYKIPFIDKQMKRGLGISATYSTGREINYRTNKNKIDFYRNEEYPYRYFQTELTYTYRPAYAIIHEVNLSYNHYAITDELFAKNPNYLGGKTKINYLELKFTVAYNNTDVRIYPLNGLDAKAILMKRGLGIDRDLNQLMLRTEISYYKKLSNHLSTSFVLRGRLSYPQNQPYITQRALGFKNEYVRGYEYYVIDGSHYALLRCNLRQRLIDRVVHQHVLPIFKIIPVRVYAKIYDDMGMVYSKHPGNSFLNNQFLNGYGAGLDIVVSYYAKFRIEYSFNHLRQNGLFLHGSKE